MLEGGVFLEGKVVGVQLVALVEDAPAQASVLSVKGHSGCSSCTKCITKRSFLKGRMCFPELDAAPRTNASFRNKVDEAHHMGRTVLEDLPHDLVIPLDYMHLV